MPGGTFRGDFASADEPAAVSTIAKIKTNSAEYSRQAPEFRMTYR
jgi:hypothetical protein